MTHRDQDEAELREIFARWMESLRARDLDRMMASYENDVVVFDVTGPLLYEGLDDYREVWRARLDAFVGPIEYEVRDLAVCAGDVVAFTHALVRLNATRAHGRRIDFWMRWSGAWKKIAGAWLVVHEHLSVPFELETGEAVLDAQP